MEDCFTAFLSKKKSFTETITKIKKRPYPQMKKTKLPKNTNHGVDWIRLITTRRK